jgi:hypothetical protein
VQDTKTNPATGEQPMDFLLRERDLLLIKGSSSFIIAGRSGRRFPLCIESFDDEVCTSIEPDDIIAVSAPEGGPKEPAVMLLELVRRYGHPLFVLPHQHPGSRRLRYVVSAGPEICLACDIQRGTHPDQHLLCASEELSGIRIKGCADGIRIDGLPEGVTAALCSTDIRTD